MNVEGLVAIVTGAASGLGAATARMLVAKGAKVTIFDLNAEAGEATAREIGGLFQSVNVTDEAAEKAYGTARILVNCAGVAPAMKAVGSEFVPHPIDNFRKAIEINLVGTFLVASRFAGCSRSRRSASSAASSSTQHRSPRSMARSGRWPMLRRRVGWSV